MKKKTVLGLLAVLFGTILDFSFAEDKPAYFKVGGEFELRPTVSDHISNVLWKLKGDLIAEWVKDIVPLDYYGRFKDRAIMDTTSGVLVMKNLTAEDAGTYTVEINNKVHPERFIGKAIKDVPKAEIWVQPLSCNSEMKNCSLVCENGNKEALSEAEPISYEWKEDSGKWQSRENTIMVFKTDSASIETYTCKMKNPVSEAQSEPWNNIFYIQPSPPDIGLAVGVPVVLFLLFGVLGFVGWKYKEKITARFSNKQGSETGGELNPRSPSNGAPEAEPLENSPLGKTEAPESA